MTPKGKKTAIIITSLLAIGGIISYFLWKHKKNKKEAEVGKSNDALDLGQPTLPSDNNTSLPNVSASKPNNQNTNNSNSSASQSSLSPQSVKGFKKNEKLYTKLSFDNAYNYPSKDSKYLEGKILRNGGKYVAIMIGNSSVKGWIKAKAVVTGYTFNKSTGEYNSAIKEIYLESKNYTNVAP